MIKNPSIAGNSIDLGKFKKSTLMPPPVKKKKE
jgi:hypothetical protein